MTIFWYTLSPTLCTFRYLLANLDCALYPRHSATMLWAQTLDAKEEALWPLGRIWFYGVFAKPLSSTWSCFLELVSNDCGLQYDLSGSQPLSAFSEHHHDSKACCTWLRVIMCALWASVAWFAWCLEERTESYWVLNLFYVCCHALTSWQYAFVAESSSCIHSSGWTWRPDLLLQWNLLHRFTVDLQIECAAFLLRTWRRQPFGSTIIEQCVPAGTLGHFTLLHFTLFLVLPASADGHQIHSTATAGTTFNDSIYSIHFLASLLILLSLWFILLMFALNGFLSPSYTCPRKANHNVVQEPQQRWQQTVVDSENLSGGAKVKASAVPRLYSTGVFSRFQSSG